jgi:hypothetical protein
MSIIEVVMDVYDVIMYVDASAKVRQNGLEVTVQQNVARAAIVVVIVVVVRVVVY